LTETLVTSPETGRLMAMFSLAASTNPTAPTLEEKVAAGGVEGGGTLACTVRDLTMATEARERTIAAKMGIPYLNMVAP
jgi:hypothetical protein